MTDLDPRTAPWRAIAGLRLILTQLATTWDDVQAWPRPCPDCDGSTPGCATCHGDGLLDPTPYDQGAADAAHVCAHELRTALEPR